MRFLYYIIQKGENMRTLTLFTLFFTICIQLFSQEKITLTEGQKDKLNNSSGWRRAKEEDKKEENTYCWERQDVGDPTFCMTQLEVYKNNLDKKGKKSLKPWEERLKKLSKGYQLKLDKENKTYQENKKKEEKAKKQREEQRREEAQAHYDAKIEGCPNDAVWVNPTAVNYSLRRSAVAITVLNASPLYVNIRSSRGVGDRAVIVRNLCPGGTMNLAFSFENLRNLFIDYENFVIQAIGRYPDGSLGKHDFPINLNRHNYSYRYNPEWTIYLNKIYIQR